jgi:hypothetical protein
MRVSAAYQVTKLTIVTDKESIEIKPEDMLYLTINKFFYTQYVPKMTMCINLDKQIIIKCKNAKTLKISFTVMEITKDVDGNSVDKKTFISDIFDADCLASDDLFDEDYSYDPNKKEVLNKTPDQLIQSDFQLYKYEHLNMFKIQQSALLRNCNPPTALIYLLNQRKLGSYIVSKGEVGKEYPSVQIPLGGLFNNIIYLNENYGLYKSTPMVFRDIDNMDGFIIIDKHQLPITTLKNKKTTMYIHPNSDGDMMVVPFDNDYNANSTLVVTVDETIMFEDAKSSMINMVEGSKVMVVDSMDVKMNNITKDENCATMKVVTVRHPLSIAQHTAGDGEYDRLKFTFEKVPMSYFKAYNLYMVKDRNTYRKYHAVDISMGLTPDNGGMLRGEIGITLSGIK